MTRADLTIIDGKHLPKANLAELLTRLRAGGYLVYNKQTEDCFLKTTADTIKLVMRSSYNLFVWDEWYKEFELEATETELIYRRKHTAIMPFTTKPFDGPHDWHWL